MPMSARIIGVDLVPIKPVRGALTITEDITSQGCRERLRKESAGSLFDVVLHDGAPNVGGAFATEMYTQVPPPPASSREPRKPSLCVDHACHALRHIPGPSLCSCTPQHRERRPRDRTQLH